MGIYFLLMDQTFLHALTIHHSFGAAGPLSGSGDPWLVYGIAMLPLWVLWLHRPTLTTTKWIVSKRKGQVKQAFCHVLRSLGIHAYGMSCSLERESSLSSPARNPGAEPSPSQSPRQNPSQSPSQSSSQSPSRSSAQDAGASVTWPNEHFNETIKRYASSTAVIPSY